MLAVMSAIGLTAHSERVLEMESGITLERAVELMLQYVKLSVIQCPLTNSLGRIVSQNIYSAIEQPPFDRSPLDGYALRSEDTIGASKTSPVHLEVTEIDVYKRQWQVLRIGMDFRLRCCGCGHEIMSPRKNIEKSVKAIERKDNE